MLRRWCFLFWINHKPIAITTIGFEIQNTTLFQSCHDPSNEFLINNSSYTIGESSFHFMGFIVKMDDIGNEIANLYKVWLHRIFFQNVLNQAMDWLIGIPEGKFWLYGIICANCTCCVPHRRQSSLVSDYQIIPLPVTIIFNALDIVFQCIFEHMIVLVSKAGFVDNHIDNFSVKVRYTYGQSLYYFLLLLRKPAIFSVWIFIRQKMLCVQFPEIWKPNCSFNDFLHSRILLKLLCHFLVLIYRLVRTKNSLEAVVTPSSPVSSKYADRKSVV